MNNENMEKMHISIAEIFYAVEKISDCFASLNINDEVAIIATRTKIIQLCNYIKYHDKLLHDELFPECE